MPPPEGDAVTADGIVRGGLSNSDFQRSSVRGVGGVQWVCIGLIERSAIWARRGQSRTTNRIIILVALERGGLCEGDEGQRGVSANVAFYPQWQAPP